MFKVYALYSPDFNKIYIGYTGNLEERIKAHNFYDNGYTKRYRPWVLIYDE